MKRRSALACIAGAASGWLPIATRAAWPERPISVVVPWPGGGLVDIPARLFAERLQRAVGQPAIVDNRAGAGGSIGAAVVAKASADGQTLLVTTSALAINEAIHAAAPFTFPKDFQAIAPLAYAPLILVTQAESGAKTLAELLARARAHPGMTFASAGNGSPGHLAGELLKSREKIEITHVAYKGAPPAMVDQVAGRVDFHFANAAVALPQIRAGKLHALAVASAKRLALLSDVPTMAEAGVPDFDTDQWIGLLAPRGTPADVVARLNGVAAETLADPQVRAIIEKNGMTPAAVTSATEFSAQVVADLAKWTRIAKAANIKAE